MKCPNCGKDVSRSDETCWSCGTLLRYGEPKGTLQSSMQGKWMRIFLPEIELPKNISLFIGLVALVMLILIGTLMAIIFFSYTTEGPQTTNNLTITEYHTNEYYDQIWFFITVENKGTVISHGTLVAEVMSNQGTYIGSQYISVAPGDNDIIMVIVQLPNNIESGSYMTSCHLQA
ncbi:MAG: hypothetical protein GKC03_08200 [Methanomassiliicoccales archaeon]|nr:hypothetical protein [Methanomassiliicoccales archaeon]NYT15613.1 hypothetical protein [Methanomassiliicoccales archaeon]